MSVQNISLVFGPNILWPKAEKGEKEHTLGDPQCSVSHWTVF